MLIKTIKISGVDYVVRAYRNDGELIIGITKAVGQEQVAVVTLDNTGQGSVTYCGLCEDDIEVPLSKDLYLDLRAKGVQQKAEWAIATHPGV